jgi:hypothetical protein
MGVLNENLKLNEILSTFSLEQLQYFLNLKTNTLLLNYDIVLFSAIGILVSLYRPKKCFFNNQIAKRILTKRRCRNEEVRGNGTVNLSGIAFT